MEHYEFAMTNALPTFEVIVGEVELDNNVFCAQQPRRPQDQGDDRHKDAKIIYFPAWWQNIGPIMKNSFEVWNGLGHEREGETSIVMARRVKKEKSLLRFVRQWP